MTQHFGPEPVGEPVDPTPAPVGEPVDPTAAASPPDSAPGARTSPMPDSLGQPAGTMAAAVPVDPTQAPAGGVDDAPVAPPPAWVPVATVGDGAPGGWGASPWGPPPWDHWTAPPPPAPRRGRTAMALVLLFAAGAAAGTGVTLVTHSSSPSPVTSSLPSGSSSSSSSSSGAAAGTSPSLAPLPTTPPQGSTGSGSGIALDPNAIAARVDPAVVDITVTIGGQGQAEGTGMILTSSGEVLTNNHVVEGATGITAQVNGTGPQYQATVIGVDPTDDVALIQMSGASGLPTIPLGDSSSVAVGDQMVALGNALGRGGTPAVTQGVVTAIGQTITASDNNGANPETLTDMIQVRAGIQPGDSGGPMVDASGHVIGMTTAGSARVRRTGTIGFGIPINKALDIARQIQSGTGPNVLPGQRGILGVEIDSTATGNGASVAQVETGSPAAGAGLVSGDTITGIDGTSIASGDALGTALRSHKPGDKVTVRWVDQNGQQHSAQVTLEAGPPA